ncbi:MFS transporter [Microbacterium barkeri]|uniref:MFS transporter n=1 Tax=Microbacterium barkeri TaxID=33917 RepID=A0A9W6H1L7_9MICO|nr:MFS transporter [Microbacterium barkeri]MDR6875292.1 MHS family metabolite:H+ symporter-like MFS transporter [Microbacterium barkeri]GLJ60545.1 MFS transporter [Microbacterium barkeri]
MSTAAPTAPKTPYDDPEYAANLRRATLASSVGSALEYFDFALYGLMTALVFNRLFFDPADPAMGVIGAFAVYGVGFVARPFGGFFFGTIGDRLGRKWVLVVTILLMGGASTAIGLLPTYEVVGVWAAALLVVMRLLQGFGAGAEQAGATVLMAEYAPVRQRGFFAALPFIGIQAGTLLAALVFSGLSLMPEDAFLAWGWRVPFLASFLLILIALFIRMRLRETPTFVELEKHEQVAAHPFRDIFTTGMPGVITGIGLRMAENGGSYIFQNVALAFVAGTFIANPVDRGIATWGVTIGSLIGIFSVPLTGWLSDRFGRRPVYRFGAVFMLLFAFPAWWMLSLGDPVLTVAVIAIGIGVAVASMLGPQCALLPEMFGNRHRYLGVAMAREISAVLAGGLAGVLGTWLLTLTGGNWVVMGLYLATLAAITTASTFLIPETRSRDLLRIQDAVRVSTDEKDTGLVSVVIADAR